MSYTPPLGNAVDTTWLGAPAYTVPASNAVDVSFVEAPTSVVGTGAVVLDFIPAGDGFHGIIPAGVGAVVLDFTPAAEGLHGVGGAGAAALDFSAAGIGKHGVAGAGAVVLDFAAAGVASHPRYELRGVVKIGDTLVNRHVFAYLRATGALVGEADTAAGYFAIHAGFAPAEHFVTPIDLDSDAVDWKPPTANRVLSVLAEDTA